MSKAPNTSESSNEEASSSEPLVLKASEITSRVLQRIIEEVRVEKSASHATYNRVHNRHNRGR